jgi:hypothetical protein
MLQGSLWPKLVWTRRQRLVRAEVCRVDVREDEVFGWNRTPRQTTQQSELSRMRHSIGKRALKQNFSSHIPEFRSELNVPCDIGKHFMEVDDSRSKVRKFGRTVAPSNEEGTRIPQQVVHVPDQLMRRSYLGGRSKRRELGRSAAESLLSAVCKRSQEMM